MARFEESLIHFRDMACTERPTHMNASENTYAYPNGIAGPAPEPAPGDDAADSRLRRIMGDDGMDRLANATVMVLGLGGVGSSCVEALVRGGVGRLVLIDRDVVSPSNVNRQVIAFQSTMGRRKIDVMREMCLDINRTCTSLPNIRSSSPRLSTSCMPSASKSATVASISFLIASTPFRRKFSLRNSRKARLALDKRHGCRQ